MTVPVAVPVAAAVGPAARSVEEDKGNQPKEGEERETERLALRSLSDHLRTVTDRRSAHGKVYEPAAQALPASPKRSRGGECAACPGMSQAVGVRRRFTPRDKDTPPKDTEWRYYGTSAPPDEAGPDVLADAIRKHWQIENCLHCRKDYTMAEDRRVLRRGRAPTNLSHLRSIVIGLLRTIEIEDLPAQTHPQKMAYLSSDLNCVVDLLQGRWRIK